MAKMSPKKWAFTCLLLLLISDTRCQKDDIKSDSQQSIDEAERREGKPQDSGNGKDTTLEKRIFIYSKHVFLWLIHNKAKSFMNLHQFDRWLLSQKVFKSYLSI